VVHHETDPLGLFFDGEANAKREFREHVRFRFARVFAAAKSFLRFALLRDSSP
jgi:hypothetical protein